MLRTICYLTLLAFVFAERGRDGGNGPDGPNGPDNDEVTSGANMTPSGTSSMTPSGTSSMIFSSTSSMTPSSISSMTPDSASSTVSATSSVQPTVSLPAPAIRFPTPSNTTTCMPLVFQWQVVPQSSNVTQMNVRLLISNDGVVQAPPYADNTPRIRRQQPSTVVSREITNRTSLAAGEFIWPAVDVPEGWYVLQASPADADPSDIAAQSERFFVMASSNTTCVSPNVPISPPTASIIPISHKVLSAGALAGTVIGAVVGLSALVAAFALPRLWRRGVPEHQAWKGKRPGLYHIF